MSNSEKQVLAFHYVWYGTPFGPAGKWSGWPGGEGRYNPDLVYGGLRMVDSPNYPLDGPYDSLDPVTIERQIQQLEHVGVDGSIVSWWGMEHYSDRVLDALMERASGTDYRITLYYETPMVKRRKGEASKADRIFEDMNYILGEHGEKDAWLKVDGKPVMVIYVVDTYPLSVWKEVKDRLNAAGIDPFFLGDTFNTEALSVMDGLHTYNPVGRLVRGVDVAALYRKVSEAAHQQDKLFAATVIPGFDDRKIRTPGTLLMREDGGCYNQTWHAAVDSGADWVLITSWNEWHEGSEIEPSLEDGTRYLWLTAQWVQGFKGA
ncbi:MAG: glycoside hydrolase family 99-like domain-containing protein [Anaerolineae bacterium]